MKAKTILSGHGRKPHNHAVFDGNNDGFMHPVFILLYATGNQETYGV